LKKWQRTSLTVFLSLALLYITFMGAYFITSTPSFCKRCHYVEPYVLSWQNEAHNKVGCLSCHEFRGFLGKLHSKARGTNYLYLHLTGQETILSKAMVFDENCIACHLGDYGKNQKTPRLNDKHYAFIKKDKSCLECHRETGHKTNLFFKENFK